ncbi:MAG TPA: GlsB/YeaQ/YmgE family stress response membrane protein [Gemmatimonadaceae bacterium]|nr:GlsB/YeaQ/YmgE family stress response membrane protein [Gemmatimonadaceae bacterium]
MPLWLYWILLGLLAGGLAKFVVPGRDPPGCLVTIALGLLGALLGGWIGTRLGWGSVQAGRFSIHSIAIATFGAVLVLLLGRLVRRLRRR